jgi:hypothetical protein
MSDYLTDHLKMNQLDRMLADNQTSQRMNQAKQLAKTAASIAFTAGATAALGALGKASGAVGKVAGAGAKATGVMVKATTAAKATGGVRTGYQTLFDLGKEKLKNPAFRAGLKKGLKESREFIKKEAVAEVKGKIKEEVQKQLPDDAKEPVQALLKADTTLGGLKNSLEAFKGLASKDTNKIINGLSKITLGSPNLTHGVVGSANKVLSGKVNSPSAIKAKEAVAKMTELENQTNTLVEKNLNILKAAGIKALPEKITTRKGQATLMNKEVPAEVLKATDWLKNKAEFLALRKDIAYLGPQVVAIKRGTFDIAKEITTLEKIEEDQKVLVEQVKTMIDHEEKTPLILDLAPEKLMNKEFLAFLNLTNGETAYKNAEAYQALATKKELLTDDLQAQLAEGTEQLKQVRKSLASDLLGDTKKMFETSKKDAEDDDRGEVDIREMRKA